MDSRASEVVGSSGARHPRPLSARSFDCAIGDLFLLDLLQDALEVLWYFASFWRFVANSEFRARVLARWREMNRGRALIAIPIEVASSLLCGLVLPVCVIYYLVSC